MFIDITSGKLFILSSEASLNGSQNAHYTIGYASDEHEIQNRLSELQTSFSKKLVLRAIVDSAAVAYLAANLQSRVATKEVENDWFSLSDGEYASLVSTAYALSQDLGQQISLLNRANQLEDVASNGVVIEPDSEVMALNESLLPRTLAARKVSSAVSALDYSIQRRQMPEPDPPQQPFEMDICNCMPDLDLNKGFDFEFRIFENSELINVSRFELLNMDTFDFLKRLRRTVRARRAWVRFLISFQLDRNIPLPAGTPGFDQAAFFKENPEIAATFEIRKIVGWFAFLNNSEIEDEVRKQNPVREYLGLEEKDFKHLSDKELELARRKLIEVGALLSWDSILHEAAVRSFVGENDGIAGVARWKRIAKLEFDLAAFRAAMPDLYNLYATMKYHLPPKPQFDSFGPFSGGYSS